MLVGGPDGAFDGELDDVRVWNCARTASEISSFRYATLQGNEPGLVALSGCEQVYPLPVSYVVNQVNHQSAQVSGRVGVVPVP